MLRYVKSNVVVEKAEDEELYANPNIKQKAEEVDKLYVNPNIIEVADNDKPTNPNHKVYDAVEKDTDDKHRNPNLKAEDIDYWNSVVSESKTNMSYPIQAAAIEEKDTPCPTDDSSDAPSVSSSDVPSVSPSEVLTPLEVTMSYDMSIPIQAAAIEEKDTPCPTDEEKKDTTYANPN